MKIFAGTLYSGENEFPECIESIKRQDYKDFQQFTFEDLPNREAHRTLFQAFLDRAGEFDLLVKVDADMVLTREDVLGSIVEWMRENPQIDVLGIAVEDFFTGGLVWGLNTYRNTVRWDFSQKTPFVDIPDVPAERVYYDDHTLAPAAFHCPNPSPLQAMHYGVHRGIKALQRKGGAAHWDSLKRVGRNFRTRMDPRLGLAVLGAEMAHAGKFSMQDLDYTRADIRDYASQASGWDAARINGEIRRYNIQNGHLLPGNLRRRMLIVRAERAVRA